MRRKLRNKETIDTSVSWLGGWVPVVEPAPACCANELAPWLGVNAMALGSPRFSLAAQKSSNHVQGNAALARIDSEGDESPRTIRDACPGRRRGVRDETNARESPCAHGRNRPGSCDDAWPSRGHGCTLRCARRSGSMRWGLRRDGRIGRLPVCAGASR